MSHQPRSCVTPNFPKMRFRYPNLTFSHKFRPKTLKVCYKKFHCLKTLSGKVVWCSTIGLLIERYQHFGRDDPVPVKFGPKGTNRKDALSRFTRGAPCNRRYSRPSCSNSSTEKNVECT